MARQSTTLKMTQGHARTISLYLRMTGQSLFLRHAGENIPVDSLYRTSEGVCMVSVVCDDSVAIMRCTIYRATLAQITEYLESYSGQFTREELARGVDSNGMPCRMAVTYDEVVELTREHGITDSVTMQLRDLKIGFEKVTKSSHGWYNLGTILRWLNY